MEQVIEEGNKLICEFMGLVGYNEKGHPDEYGYYHKRWDYLMPVVEKINNMKIKKIGKIDVIIYKSTCHINDEMQIIVEGTGRATIEAVWNTVILFIQWYNNQNKSK